MTDPQWLAQQFEENRRHLRAVAYRMLGSVADANDAAQEAWLRLSRSDAAGIANLSGWLTTVVAHVCLDMLRSRKSHGEVPLALQMPEPIVSREDHIDPEQQALLADSIGLALLVVLDTLDPAERVAFVLHDMFAMSFAEIAGIVGRSEAATRQLASRARRRVQGARAVGDVDLRAQREVVDAFMAAARSGDFEALVALLDPDVVVRGDRAAAAVLEGVPAAPSEVRGARNVAAQALMFSHLAGHARHVLVNGAAGLVARLADGRLFSVMGFTIVGGKIVEMDILTNPERLAQLDLTALED